MLIQEVNSSHYDYTNIELVLGVFALSVEFPKKYPFTQPEIRFLTPVSIHINIVYCTIVRYIIAMLVAAVGGYVMQYLESHTHHPPV